MASAITMPRLGLSMVEGTVTEWKVRPGDVVTKGQAILTVESEKAEVEVEAFDSGVLAHVYVETGATVPIGALLGVITAPGTEFDAAAFQAAFVPEVEGAPATAPRGGATRAASPAPERRAEVAAAPGVKVAPAARGLAKKLGIDVETVTGTGPGGRILPEDVQRAAATRVTIGGVRFSAEATGQGPALLFVNGYAVDATGWRRQVEDLARDHRTITYDHRGVGDSEPSDSATLAALAADAAALLGHFAAVPAVVVGASMGAAIALELALSRPEAVRGLVLLTPVVDADPRLEAVLRSWTAIAEPAARARAMLPWLLGREHLGHAGRREAAAGALRAMAARVPLDTLDRHARALLSWLGSRREELGRIEARTLVLAGTEDLLAPAEGAEALARSLRHARFERLDGAGHALMIERADEVNRLIRAFVSA